MKKIVLFKDTDFDGYIVGIFEQNDGTFQALTGCWSKNYKTLKGAIKGIIPHLTNDQLELLQQEVA